MSAHEAANLHHRNRGREHVPVRRSFSTASEDERGNKTDGMVRNIVIDCAWCTRPTIRRVIGRLEH